MDKGTNLVVCQHSHCIGCKEEYRAGTIVYGQGNFLFDGARDNEYWNTWLLISVSGDGSVGYIPLRKTSPGVRLAEGNEAERIFTAFEKRSGESCGKGSSIASTAILPIRASMSTCSILPAEEIISSFGLRTG